MKSVYLFILSAAVLAGGCGQGEPSSIGAEVPVEIRVLSNRADLISGGDALVEVRTGPGVDASRLVMDLNGRDVSPDFALRPNGRVMGLLSGLADGANALTAGIPGGPGARITLTNHPIGGPIFAGEQVQPWVCTSAGQGLGTPQDAQCNAPAQFAFFYKSTGSEDLQPYNSAAPPADVAMTTTDEGKTVPFIIRRERGAMDRGLYHLAVLFDPAHPWTAWAPQAAWNGKLFYTHGASCNTNYNQGEYDNMEEIGAAEINRALALGFAIARSTLNVAGQVCNTVLSAEATMMLKEHFIERYGEIRYTIGRGNSGGSIPALTVANAYPGLFQGALVSTAFPDIWTTGHEVLDCLLLTNYFIAKSPLLWTDVADMTAVSGGGSISVCVSWVALFAPTQDPTHGCGLLKSSYVPIAGTRTLDDYHPVLNPRGCRATVQDMQVGIWGRRPQDGFAKLAYDNIGVQYGLLALRASQISPQQFVDLNEKIGGVDIDRNTVAARSLADPDTPLIGHRSGQVNDATGLGDVAIIDQPSTDNIEIHTPYHAFTLEERLVKAHGHHQNHAVWLGGETSAAFDALNRWLADAGADTRAEPLATKLLRHRPAAAVDSCFINGEQVSDAAACAAAYPVFGAPRIAAGAPHAVDVLKCRLKPLDRSSGDYGGVTFTDAQWARLQAVFPAGVCDWGQPGEAQVPTQPWTTFVAGPGGRPLNAAPVSEPR
ncbi:MAG: DUF6351 family protein [Nevskiales bacterium]